MYFEFMYGRSVTSVETCAMTYGILSRGTASKILDSKIKMILEARSRWPKYVSLAEDTLLRDAKQEGREEGREAGSIEARIATLTRLLHRRFGALTDALPPRLHQATVQQLDGWLDRILDARTLDEVFSDAPLNARAPLTR